MPNYNAIYILLLAVGGSLILCKMIFKFPDRSIADRIIIISLAIVSLFSVWGYTRFGHFMDYRQYGKHTYHYHDIYHYAFGAKYYKELGYYNIYDFTYVALRELEEEGAKIPKIDSIRSLKNPYIAIPAQEVYQAQKDKTLHHFSQKRWDEFKNDLKTFLSFGCIDKMWKDMLFDLGFNPPPSWNIFAGWIVNLIPFSQITMEILPFIDMVLIFIIAGYFVWKSFGIYPLFGYYIILGNNFLAHYGWTGGSYFRQVWFFFLVLALCSLKKEKFKLSGVFFGLSTALRIFPAFFFFGALWPLIYMFYVNRLNRKNLVFFLSSGIFTIVIIFSISILAYGIDYWRDFFQKISNHNNTYFAMHVGFKKCLVFSKEIANQNFHEASGLKSFLHWQNQLQEIYQAKIVPATILKFLMLAGSLIIALRIPLYWASFMVGGTILFFFLIPGNYYYVYLAILPALFFSFSEKRTAVVRMFLLFVLMISILVLPMISKDVIIYNGYINALIFYFFIGIYITFFIEIFPSFRRPLCSKKS